MRDTLEQIRQAMSDAVRRMDIYDIMPGVELTYLTVQCDRLSFGHEPLDRILEINYCKAGRIGWQMAKGYTVYLGAGDYAVHTMKSCSDSVMTFPNRFYEGITVCINLDELSASKSDILCAAGIDGDTLYGLYGVSGQSLPFAGNEISERIFEKLYTEYGTYTQAYRMIGIYELLLFIGNKNHIAEKNLNTLPTEQVNAVRAVHDYVLSHIDGHSTVEELAKRFYINATTLKTVFHAVYGDSIATHMRTHRMEKASDLLVETDLRIADIAVQVGYGTQSRFTDAFRNFYGILPSDYRKAKRMPKDNLGNAASCAFQKGFPDEKRKKE